MLILSVFGNTNKEYNLYAPWGIEDAEKYQIKDNKNAGYFYKNIIPANFNQDTIFSQGKADTFIAQVKVSEEDALFKYLGFIKNNHIHWMELQDENFQNTKEEAANNPIVFDFTKPSYDINLSKISDPFQKFEDPSQPIIPQKDPTDVYLGIDFHISQLLQEDTYIDCLRGFALNSDFTFHSSTSFSSGFYTSYLYNKENNKDIGSIITEIENLFQTNKTKTIFEYEDQLQPLLDNYYEIVKWNIQNNSELVSSSGSSGSGGIPKIHGDTDVV